MDDFIAVKFSDFSILEDAKGNKKLVELIDRDTNTAPSKESLQELQEFVTKELQKGREKCAN